MYVLPYGQMSLWGATVITNLMSAIPWIGQDIVEFIWGGFSVNNATLNRFFSLHYLLPFILAALVLMHLIALHDSAGSGNPLGISANSDRLPFSPYFIFKDLVTIFLFILILSIFVFFMPNVLGDSENYVMANPMQTPSAIVPEWYLLPFYAILRSIPNKLLGVIAMFLAILILLLMPFTDLSRSRGIQFRPFSKIAFFFFFANFLILMQLGAKHVESPYIELGQISTIIYFSYFLLITPILSLLENSLLVLSNYNKDRYIRHLYQEKRNISYFFIKSFKYNKKVVFLFFLYFILFFVLFHLTLIALTKLNLIFFPYGLIAVEYAMDDNYSNWLLADMEKEKETILKEYRYYTERLYDCHCRVKRAKKITSIFTGLSDRGFHPPVRPINKGINHYGQRWRVFQLEYEAWDREFLRMEVKLDKINNAIDDKIIRWRPWVEF